MKPSSPLALTQHAYFAKLAELAVDSLTRKKPFHEAPTACDVGRFSIGIAPTHGSIKTNRTGYLERRDQRGLPSRVFADPSQRRGRRLSKLVMTTLLVLLVWASVFLVELVSKENALAHASDKSLPIPMFAVSEHPPGWSGLSPDETPATSSEAPVSSAPFEAKCASSIAQVMPESERIYAFLPRSTPWADRSLKLSCDRVGVLMPEWYSLGVTTGRYAITAIDTDDIRALKSDALKRRVPMQLLPVITLDEQAVLGLRGDNGNFYTSMQLLKTLESVFDEGGVEGFCLDLSSVDLVEIDGLKRVLNNWSDRARDRGLRSCLVLSGTTSAASLGTLSEVVDRTVVKMFQEPWVGSLPGPLAPQDWFETALGRARDSIDSEKLIIALGAGAVDWVSSKAKPDQVPYAQAMTELALAQSAPIYDSLSGNSFAAFVDESGARHRVWMLDAASFHNQRTALTSVGVQDIAVWGLGQEDPGIWDMLKTGLSGVPLSTAEFRDVKINQYTRSEGQGSFVVPLFLARDGQREMEFDPGTGLVADMIYTTLPMSSVVRYYGAAQPNQIVLTFDDGPHPTNTPKILDILKAENVPATFFVLGQNVAKHPGILERAYAEGHEIGSHTYYHSHMDRVSSTWAKAEVNAVQMLVSGILGHGMRMYRDPYMNGGNWLPGSDIPHLKRLSDAGYLISGMDVVPHDWNAENAEAIVDEILSLVENGSGNVVLLHDGGGNHTKTVEALPRVISELKARGYEFVSLSSLLNVSREAIMPEVDVRHSAFNNISFLAVSHSWTVLIVVFWSVLAIGLMRSILMLVLAVCRRRHAITDKNYTPSVAVIIPAYNEEKVISRSIETVLASHYPELQVIVVDDGSRDFTYNRALYYENDSRVKVLHQHNRGKSAALNFGLDETDAEVLVCIDADSQVHPDAIRRMVSHFADPNVGAVAGKVVVGNRSSILTRLQCLEYMTSQNIDRRAKEILNAIPVVPGAIGAWRSTAVLEAGIYTSETITEDADLTMSIIRSGYKVVYEEAAIATTEVPRKLRDLVSQRRRWSLGMLQTCWKHVGAFREGRALGLVTLPDLAIFGFLLPMLAPLADVFLLIAAYNYFFVDTAQTLPAASMSKYALLAYLALPLIDFATLCATFAYERKESPRLLWLFPLQRIFYRQILYYCVYIALWRAMNGRLVQWSKIQRVGYQYDHAKLT